jgi:hypothetical protein
MSNTLEEVRGTAAGQLAEAQAGAAAAAELMERTSAALAAKHGPGPPSRLCALSVSHSKSVFV